MKNVMCEMFGIDPPIFAFSHCRDVLVEGSKTAGAGVLGTPTTVLVVRAHARDIRVAALAGSTRHAIRHRDAGFDFVIAVGIEAGVKPEPPGMGQYRARG